MTTLRSLLAGTVALVASLAFVADALAQAQTQTPPASPPTRLRGAITAIDGKTAHHRHARGHVGAGEAYASGVGRLGAEDRA